MNRKVLALLPLFLLAVAVGAAEGPAELRSGVFDPPRMAPDFSLRGSDGSQVELNRYRGKVVALGFGYTNCPSVCPVTLGYLAEARKKLGARGKDLQVVYVTVDPERDNPEHLRKFLASFDPTFVGATGTREQLADVRKAYGITLSDKIFTDAGSKSKATYFLDHSSFVYLIDRGGKLRAMMPFGVTADD
ncbi:MAG TPA: SCO family protein, partial [Gemmatimonadaceae bacterium]